MNRLLILAVLSTAPAAAHDWYPNSCCGGNDCKPVPCDEIHTLPQGYSWQGFKWPTAQPSPDGACHVCIVPPNQWSPARPTCLFIGSTS